VARRLILDTGVLVAAERSRRGLASVVAADDDVVIAAITVAELRTGIELADEQHQWGRADFVARILQTTPIEPYDLAVAEVHGSLLAHARRSGRQRGAHDLIIAATAIATRRTLVTTDRGARFTDLPGIECLVVGG